MKHTLLKSSFVHFICDSHMGSMSIDSASATNDLIARETVRIFFTYHNFPFYYLSFSDHNHPMLSKQMHTHTKPAYSRTAGFYESNIMNESIFKLLIASPRL